MPSEIMARVLFNARASTAGGGLTYLRNVLPRLSVIPGGNSFVVAVQGSHLKEFAAFESHQLKLTPVEDRRILLANVARAGLTANSDRIRKD